VRHEQLNTTDAMEGVGPVRTGTLLLIELRKLVDTPSGIALVLAAVLLAGVFGGGQVLFGDHTTIDDIALLAGTPAGVLVPVLAILSVTAERSHRTALVTYALVPRRGRIVVAKSLSAAVVALLVTPLTLLAAVIIAPVGQAITGHLIDWTVDMPRIAVFTLSNVALAVSGTALALAMGNAPAAIVVILAWPMLTLLLSVRPEIAAVLAWLDLGSISALGEHHSATDAGRVATSTAFWVALPMIIGVRRVLVEEVR
jgi:ABC-type transport system involved in multi-copper enzyme maturation permease subunit